MESIGEAPSRASRLAMPPAGRRLALVPNHRAESRAAPATEPVWPDFEAAEFLGWAGAMGWDGTWVDFPELLEIVDDYCVEVGRARPVSRSLRGPLMRAGAHRWVSDRRQAGGTKVVCYRVPRRGEGGPGIDHGTGPMPLVGAVGAGGGMAA